MWFPEAAPLSEIEQKARRANAACPPEPDDE